MSEMSRPMCLIAVLRHCLLNLSLYSWKTNLSHLTDNLWHYFSYRLPTSIEVT